MIFITISISLLLPRLTQSECQGNSNCLKLESVYHSICNNHAETRTLARGRPGKMGPIGKKGEKGEKGIAVNYEHVEELIRKQIKALESQDEKVKRISTTLEEANIEIQQMRKKLGPCPITFDGKCFWVESRDDGVSFIEAVQICNDHGAKPANIYSENHYYMLLNHLRVFAGKVGHTDAYLGMTYSTETRQVLTSNGTAAPFVKWYPTYPQNSNILILRARMDWDSTYQHFYTQSLPDTRARGVICEK